jgi:iron(III) transport system substrate-binding protein
VRLKLSWAWFAPIALIALLALAAACGDDDDDDGPSEATATADPEADPNPTSEGDPEADPDPSADPTADGSETEDDGDLTVYSGRSESLVGPLIEQFEEESSIDVSVRYAGTSELAALLLEEGDASPADVFFSQDGGALGAVAAMLEPLPEEMLGKVDPKYRAEDGSWIGLSGRARVLAYNTDLDEATLPDSYTELTDPAWEGRVGWAPTNASFQTWVTMLRVVEGEDVAREWLEAMIDNGAQVYEGNPAIVQAVANGEIDLGLVNHYYVWGFVADQGEDFAARNHYMAPGDPGAFVNVAGAGILATSEHHDAALELLDYMLSEEGQLYFSEQTYEYPLVAGIPADERLVPLDEIQPPDVDLSDLSDLEGTLDLLQEVGLLE